MAITSTLSAYARKGFEDGIIMFFSRSTVSKYINVQNPRDLAILQASMSAQVDIGGLTKGWPSLSREARKKIIPKILLQLYNIGAFNNTEFATSQRAITQFNGVEVVYTPKGVVGSSGFVEYKDFEIQNVVNETLLKILKNNGTPTLVEPPLYDVQAIFNAKPPAPSVITGTWSEKRDITSNAFDLKIINFVGTTEVMLGSKKVKQAIPSDNRSSNGIPYKIGDHISFTGFKVPTSAKNKGWVSIDGVYTVKGLVNGDRTYYAGLYVTGGPSWISGFTSALGIPYVNSISVPYLSSISTNGAVSVTPRPDNEQNIFETYVTFTVVKRLTLMPEYTPYSTGVVISLPKPPPPPPSVDNPTVGIFPVTDPYIEPVQTTPTKPAVVTPPNVTTPTTPTSKPTPTVKLAGTTVSIPFLTNASFKPGTSAAANAKGKTAFINLVKKASVSSRLTQAQSAQLMATVIKAIDDALLVKKNSLTRLRPAPVVTRNPIKKLNQ